MCKFCKIFLDVLPGYGNIMADKDFPIFFNNVLLDLYILLYPQEKEVQYEESA